MELWDATNLIWAAVQLDNNKAVNQHVIITKDDQDSSPQLLYVFFLFVFRTGDHKRKMTLSKNNHYFKWKHWRGVALNLDKQSPTLSSSSLINQSSSGFKPEIRACGPVSILLWGPQTLNCADGQRRRSCSLTDCICCQVQHDIRQLSWK